MTGPNPYSRRDFLKLSGFAIATVGLASCGAPGNGTSSNPSGSTSGGGNTPSRATLMWTWPGGFSPDLIAEISAKYPGLDLKNEEVPGEYGTKFQTVLGAGSGAPDIAGVKGSVIGGGMAAMFPNADRFVDLATLGADSIKSDFLEWKWQQGVTPAGQILGLPLDIGPTGLMYRADLFEAAGLAATSEEVSSITSWDEYFAWGEELAAKQGGVSLVANAVTVFQHAVGQSEQMFFTSENEFIADQADVRRAWDYAVAAAQRGLTAKYADWSTDWSTAMGNGSVATFPGPTWLVGDVKRNGAATSGQWQIAQAPGGPANLGGSFVSILQGAPDPQLAFDFLKELQSAANQARTFNDTGLYPSTLASYDSVRNAGVDEFFGGLNIIDVFSEAAQNIPVSYISPWDDTVLSAFTTELQNVESSGKDSGQAWDDAIETAKRNLKQSGVEVK